MMRGVWIDIEYPSGETLPLFIPEKMVREMEEDFYRHVPNGNFDLDYMDIRVVQWSGVMKEIGIYYYNEWEYYLPFRIEDGYAVAVESIMR